MTILITGAAGFIGFHLSRRLLSEGNTVIGLDNLNDYYDPELKKARLKQLEPMSGFRFIRGDLTDSDLIDHVFLENRPDIVVHLAAQAGVRYSIENPECYINSNLVGFFRILEACRHYPVHHLVYASSSSVYGHQERTPFSVDDRADHPISLYAATKRSGEMMGYCYSHLYGIPMTGLWFFTVYGPWGRPDMAYFSFTKKILAGETIRVFNFGDQYRDFTYVDDIVEGIMRLLDDPPEASGTAVRHRLYNIGNNHPEKLLRFIEILEETIGKTAEKEFRPAQPGDVFKTYADIGPLERDYGFRPMTPLEEGLKRFYEWYRDYYGGKQ